MLTRRRFVSFCPALLTILPDDPRQICFCEFIHQICSALPGARIHSHIQGRIILKAETTRYRVQLIGRHTNIQ